ncbi:MAG: hypothetical protein NZX77_10490, partial [Polyangiaceae bacterium]|nr:hypothetical protein [Polyangiaceae bacterium]
MLRSCYFAPLLGAGRLFAPGVPLSLDGFHRGLQGPTDSAEQRGVRPLASGVQSGVGLWALENVVAEAEATGI